MNTKNTFLQFHRQGYHKKDVYYAHNKLYFGRKTIEFDYYLVSGTTIDGSYVKLSL